MPTFLGWAMALAIAAFVIGVPVLRYRMVYTHSKRLREVEPGRVYRCGRMTGDGFADALRRYKIRTVINLMNEETDPLLAKSYFGGEVCESKVCEQHGVRYVAIPPELLPPIRPASERPASIETYLEVLDDPASYPVLIHCRAGLHRTGVFTAIYRMEYQGWSRLRAWDELRAHGFGETRCFADNPYITQYLLDYRPGVRKPSPEAGTKQPGREAHTPMTADTVIP